MRGVVVKYAYQPNAPNAPMKGNDMTKTLNPKELAVELDTDAKTVRKFLRSKASGLAAEAPGKGGRWAIESKKVRSLKSKFGKWADDQAKEMEAIKALRNAAAADEVPEDATEGDEVPQDDAEVKEITEG